MIGVSTFISKSNFHFDAKPWDPREVGTVSKRPPEPSPIPYAAATTR